MDGKLELIVLPVADVDRAKQFYTEQLAFKVEVDYQPNEDFRVVQLTPNGSRCSIALMPTAMVAAQVGGTPGKISGLHLVVTDIEVAHAELVAQGVAVGEPFHFVDGKQQTGLDPQRGDYSTFASFTDPDGHVWLVQERKTDPYDAA